MDLRPRIIVTTDITSTQAGYKEPDDAQSLIRLLSMSDSYQIEGLIASSRLRHGQDVCPEHIREIIKAYAQVRPELLRHSKGFPSAKSLLECVKAGQPVALPDLPPEASLGDDTEGSDWIIRCLQRDDDRPLWVIVWGGTADLAQALWRMRESLGAREAKSLRRRLRVFSISDQDSTAKWIREQFPDVFYILSMKVHRGMYRWGDTTLCSSDWVRENVIDGHGPLGAAYPDYKGGDILGALFGPVHGIKEGDTPSFLYLFPNGLSVPERPNLGGWGGRFASSGPRQFTDAEDDVAGDEWVRKVVTVYRWREAYQREFAARMDWCVKPPSQCAHPPVVKLAGPARRRAKSGDTIWLDVSQSRGTDGGGVCCRWTTYPSSAQIDIDQPAASRTRATVGEASPGNLIHLVAEVTGAGSPAFTRYARIEIQITG